MFYKDIDSQRVLFGGFINQWLVPKNLRIKYITLQILDIGSSSNYEPISMIFNNTIIHSQNATQNQLFEWTSNNTVFLKNDLIQCKLLNRSGQDSNMEKAILNIVYEEF